MGYNKIFGSTFLAKRSDSVLSGICFQSKFGRSLHQGWHVDQRILSLQCCQIYCLLQKKNITFLACLAPKKMLFEIQPLPGAVLGINGATNRLELSFSRDWAMDTSHHNRLTLDWMTFRMKLSKQQHFKLASHTVTTQRAAGTLNESNVTISSTILSRKCSLFVYGARVGPVLLGSRHVQDGHLCNQRPQAPKAFQQSATARTLWDPHTTSHINVVSNVMTSSKRSAKQLNTEWLENGSQTCKCFMMGIASLVISRLDWWD